MLNFVGYTFNLAYIKLGVFLSVWVRRAENEYPLANKPKDFVAI